MDGHHYGVLLPQTLHLPKIYEGEEPFEQQRRQVYWNVHQHYFYRPLLHENMAQR